MLPKLQDHLQKTDILPPHSKIVLAVSGGVDSVSLLHLLHQLKHYYNWQIAIAHYNHKARADSHQDAELVAQLAHSYDYPFYLEKYNGEVFSEAALRKARYDFLHDVREEFLYDYIVTAHHGGDRVETAIFNTIRGTGRHGLTALKARRDAILRPLLPFTKAEIITYASVNNLAYREDSSNADVGFSRNFVRHGIIPQGTTMYRNFYHAFTKTLNDLSHLNTRIDSQLDELLRTIALDRSPEKVVLDKTKFDLLPSTIQAELILTTARQLTPGMSIGKDNITQALKYLKSAKTGSHKQLKNNLYLQVSYGTLEVTCQPVEPKDSSSKSTLMLTRKNPVEFGNFHIRLSSLHKKHPNTIIVPKQKVFVRSRQAGDRVHPVGMSGSKKVQDIFVDKKIPKNLRDHWPIVVNSRNEIVWIPSVVSDRRFVDTVHESETMTIVCEEIKSK